MKTLIVSKKKQDVDQVCDDLLRFSRMVAGLQRGGIWAQHAIVDVYEEMKDLLAQFKPDLVFNAAYSFRDAESTEHIVHGLLEHEHIAYIGSDERALALALSKPALKKRWKMADILTPDYFVIRKALDGSIEGMDAIARANSYPYILKPAREGNSRGIGQDSIVSDEHALRIRVDAMLSLFNEILVEKYLGDDEQLREFTIAMIGNYPNKLILPCEIKLIQKMGHRLVTTEDKDKHHTEALAVEEPALHSALVSFAQKAFTVARVRDYARFDVLLSEGRLYAIEINGQPMVPDNWFKACAHDAGLNTDQYLNAIFMAGIVRNNLNGSPGLKIPEEMAEILPPAIYQRLLRLEREETYGFSN